MTETWGEGVSKQVLSPLPTLLLVLTCSWGAGGGGAQKPLLWNYCRGVGVVVIHATLWFFRRFNV